MPGHELRRIGLAMSHHAVQRTMRRLKYVTTKAQRSLSRIFFVFC